MLAHLVHPHLGRNSRRVWTIALLTVAVLGFARRAWAADALPLGHLDVGATAGGNVSSATVGRPGDMSMSLGLEAADNPLETSTLGGTEPGLNDPELLRTANRGSLLFGWVIMPQVELSLGIQGTFEHARPEMRDALTATTQQLSSITWRENLKETGFSGASLLAKVKLLDWRGLGLALAPFVESGAGEQASYALTRSVSPKGGALAIASYGEAGVAVLDLNVGYRYRDPESIGTLVIGNEVFYSTDVKAYLTRNAAVYVAYQGRSLDVGHSAAVDDQTPVVYHAEQAGEVVGGVQVDGDETALAAFYGGRVGPDSAIGFGRHTFGLSMSWTIGRDGHRPRYALTSDIDSEPDEAAVAATDGTQAKAKAAVKNDKNAKDSYSEMIGADVDPLDAVGPNDDDDFRNVPKQIEQAKRDAATESDDARVERELKEIREAEAKAEVEKTRQDQLDLQRQRAERMKRAKQEDAQMHEWLEDAQKDANTVPGIDKQEMNWNGLE